MSSKIFILAFVSAAFFFACSADNTLSGSDRSTGYCFAYGDCYNIDDLDITILQCGKVGSYYTSLSSCQANSSGDGSTGYCLIENICFNMTGLGVTISQCNAEGAYYANLSGCQAAGGSDVYCYDPASDDFRPCQ